MGSTWFPETHVLNVWLSMLGAVPITIFTLDCSWNRTQKLYLLGRTGLTVLEILRYLEGQASLIAGETVLLDGTFWSYCWRFYLLCLGGPDYSRKLSYLWGQASFTIWKNLSTCRAVLAWLLEKSDFWFLTFFFFLSSSLPPFFFLPS